MGAWLGIALGASLGPLAAPVTPDVPEPPAALLEMELSWTAPAPCPDRERIRQSVATLIDGRVELAEGVPVAVRGEVTAEPSGFRLELSLRTEAGLESRSLQAAQCGDLGTATALIVATTVYPQRVAASIERPSTMDPGAAPTPAEGAPPPVDPAPIGPTDPPSDRRRDSPDPPPTDSALPTHATDQRAAPRLRIGLSVAAGPAFGPVPRVGAQLQGAVSLLLGRARIHASVLHAFARSSAAPDEPGVSAAYTGGGLAGCFAPNAGPVEVPLCGGVELGGLAGTGEGPSVQIDEARALWVGLHVGAGVAWAPVPAFALTAQLATVLGLRRPGFHVGTSQGPQELFRAPSVGARGLFGVEIRFR